MLEKVKEKALTILENKLKSLDQNDLLCLNNALIDLGKIISELVQLKLNIESSVGDSNPHRSS